MKKSDALSGLVASVRRFDSLTGDRKAERVHIVAWCGTAKRAKATEAEIGDALKNEGVSLKRAQAGKLALIGGVVADDLAAGSDPLDISTDVARLVAAMEKLIKAGGDGARDTVRNNVAGVKCVATAADVLEALCPEDDPAAVLLAQILKLTTKFVEEGYVPSDLDAMTEIQANIGTMVGRC